MLHFDVFKKNSGIVSPSCFVYVFSRKIFLVLYSLTWPIFFFWLLLLLQIFDNIYIAIVCFTGCDVINFGVNLNFLTKPVFLHDRKLKTKISISWEQREILRWIKKHISSFLKCFQLPKIIGLTVENLFPLLVLNKQFINGNFTRSMKLVNNGALY